MEKRIFITGPSGVGKTTLALYISERHGIPYINTSASQIWKQYGFESHKDAHQKSNLNPDVGIAYQFDVLARRHLSLLERDEFVCDRSPIDNLVYFLLNISPYASQQTTEAFIKKCRDTMLLGNGIISIPFTADIRLTDNRISNPYYHQMVGIINHWVLFSRDYNINQIGNIITLNHWDFKIRKNLVNEWLGSW